MPSALLEAMRPRQWTKNLFVFAGVIFGHRLTDPWALGTSIAAFLVFCVLSSGVYLINDLVDAERDRQHPTKRDRPIASGRLAPGVARTAAIGLLLVSLAWAWAITWPFAVLALIYVLLNLAYTLRLKHIVILDVLCIAIFFVLRAAAGAAAIDVTISHWLLICTILIALFIALSKRRHELVLLSNDAGSHRASLMEYSPYLLDQMIAVVTASTLMAYILYTVDARTVHEFGSDRLSYTIPFVIFGIFRYLYLVHQKGEGGNPDRIIVSDRQFLVNLLLWGMTVGLVIYLR
jgi:4-hydroxybenzoate polyprenyltransferase